MPNKPSTDRRTGCLHCPAPVSQSLLPVSGFRLLPDDSSISIVISPESSAAVPGLFGRGECFAIHPPSLTTVACPIEFPRRLCPRVPATLCPSVGPAHHEHRPLSHHPSPHSPTKPLTLEVTHPVSLAPGHFDQCSAPRTTRIDTAPFFPSSLSRLPLLAPRRALSLSSSSSPSPPRPTPNPPRTE